MSDLSASEAKITCAACHHELSVAGHEPFSTLSCPHCGSPLTVPLRLAHFLLLTPVGTGATGTVYRAMDLSLHRYVAVKLLRKELASRPDFIASFSREARAAAALNHPNIAQIYSFGEHEGQFYLVMELLAHGSLDALIEQRKRLTELETLEFGWQMASALGAAYQRGLIHRDVKPGNMLIGDDGAARLVDFGLAKFRDADPAGAQQGIWGTPYYFAPEKLHGHVEDFRSDMYSLGGTLFHCIAGRAPFEADTADGVVEKNLTAAAISLKTFAPDISDATALLIARLLRKNPDERYPSYDELIHDLDLAKNIAAQHRVARVQRTVPQKNDASFWMQVVGFSVAGVVVLTLLIANWNKIFKPRTSLTPEPVVPAIRTPAETPTPPRPISTLEANFRRANQMLNIGNLGEAAPSYVLAAAELRNTLATASDDQRPRLQADREWAIVMLSITFLLDNNTQAARTLQPLIPANAQAAHPVSYANFPATLALLLTEKIPITALDNDEPSLPPWARAALALARGAKQYSDGNYVGASQSFNAYRAVPREADHGWLFEFHAFIPNLGDELTIASTTIERARQLQRDTQYKQALEELTKGQGKIPGALPPVRQRFEVLRTELTTLLDEQRQKEREKQEQERQERLKEQRAKIEQEKNLVGDAESDLTKWLATYNFDEIQKLYAVIGSGITTPEGREALKPKTFIAAQLVAFKAQLIADIAATPYEKNDLVTTQKAALSGSLNKADAQKLTFTRRVGENFSETEARWTQLDAAQWVKLAEHYLALAKQANTPADKLADRQMALAVFCKFYNLQQKAEAAARAAVQTKPAYREPARQLFGRSF